MTASELLRNARAEIANPERWCQAQYRDDCGRQCALGALGYGSFNMPDEALAAMAQAGRFLALATGHVDARVDVYNDTHTHDEVLALFDKAIAAAEVTG